MKPIEFKEQNIIYAENQDEYQSMPAHRVDGDPSGTVICCWQLTEEERKQVAETGLLWCSTMTFNSPLQPHLLSAESPFITGYEEEKCST